MEDGRKEGTFHVLSFELCAFSLFLTSPIEPEFVVPACRRMGVEGGAQRG